MKNNGKTLSPSQLAILWGHRAQKVTELQTVGVFHTAKGRKQ